MLDERDIFPVIFGSALKLNGVEELLGIMNRFCTQKSYGNELSAKVYKISRDDRGERLTHIKVTGGVIKSKCIINDEKVNQIRVYSGDKFTAIQEIGRAHV